MQSKLTQLQILDLRCNQFVEFPEALCEMLAALTADWFSDGMEGLLELHMLSNCLQSVKKQIAQLSQLKKLNLNRNQLRSLPEELFTSMPNLQHLLLANNQLMSLPSEIALPALVKLSLKGNTGLQVIPPLNNLPSLQVEIMWLPSLPRC